MQFCVYLLPVLAGAQPIVCSGEEVIFSHDCRSTCVTCDLNGVTGLVDQAEESRSLVNNTCSAGIGDVIGFLSLSDYLSVEVAIGNCDTEEEGTNFVEVIAYQPTLGSCFDESIIPSGISLFDCDDISTTAAVHRVNENSTKVFESMIPLNIGEIYFLEVTTIQKAKCEYTVKVLEGDTRIPDVTTPELIGNNEPCLGDMIIHELKEPQPFTSYTFTLNGDTVSIGPATAAINYDTPGNYELCVQADNVCSFSETVCYEFSVRDLEPVFVDRNLCPSNCVVVDNGITICEAGEYYVPLVDRNGCDSTVVYRITAREESERIIEASVCSGDSILFLGRVFKQSGDYPITLLNRYGCDSIINFSLAEEFCPVLGTISGEKPVCAGQASGSLQFELTSGVPPFVYEAEKLGDALIVTGEVMTLNEPVVIEELTAGTYFISITDNVGSTSFLNISLTNPEPIMIEAETRAPSCFGELNGSIDLEVIGGQGPYFYEWEGSEESIATRSMLSAGTYIVTVMDFSGCSRSTTVSLTEPTKFILSYTVNDESCGSPGSGSLSIGSQAEMITVTSPNFSQGQKIDPEDYNRLSAGSYFLSAVDNNGCLFTDSFRIASPDLPEYELRVDEPIIELGQFTQVRILGEETISWRWRLVDSLEQLSTARTLELSPVQTTSYPIDITAPSGCTVVDSLTIVVDRTKKVYVPSAFSPNGDGVNDWLQPFFGAGAENITAFSVHDRWGGEVYSEPTSSPTENIVGWNGLINGQAAPTGSYVWQMVVRFLDGEYQHFNGIVNLIR